MCPGPWVQLSLMTEVHHELSSASQPLIIYTRTCCARGSMQMPRASLRGCTEFLDRLQMAPGAEQEEDSTAGRMPNQGAKPRPGGRSRRQSRKGLRVRGGQVAVGSAVAGPLNAPRPY